MLLGDRLIPAKLLDPVFRTQWYNMLRADQGIDKGCVTFICYRGPHYSKDLMQTLHAKRTALQSTQ